MMQQGLREGLSLLPSGKELAEEVGAGVSCVGLENFEKWVRRLDEAEEEG